VKTVQTWLGHASAELTLNLYCHHPGTDADRAGIARDNAIFGDATGTRRLSSSKRNTLAATETGSDLGGCGEPEKGIEPLTYALRVRRSAV
jgi:hypothetical protein